MTQDDKQTDDTRDIEEELRKIKGKSWYEAEEEYRAKTGRKSVTRIIFTSLVQKYRNENAEIVKTVDIASNIYDFFVQFHDYNDGDEISKLYGGVALVSDDESVNEDMSVVAAFGFLETQTPAAACDCLRKLHEKEAELSLASIRILLVTDDCPCNDFGEFGVYFTIPPTEDYFDIEEEGVVKVFKSIMKHLCKQSLAFPSEATKYENYNHVKVLSGLQSRSIPSTVRIKNCAKCDSFPTLREYLDIYDSDTIPLDLESDNLSPMQPIIDWKSVYDIAMACYGTEGKKGK